MKQMRSLVPERPDSLIGVLVWLFAAANAAVMCLALAAGISALVT